MLNPNLRPSAEQLLDSSFFYESPRPLENIKRLLSKIKVFFIILYNLLNNFLLYCLMFYTLFNF